MKKIKLLSLIGLSALLTFNSCTDLAEEPFSVLTKDNYFTNKASVESLVIRVYDQMQWVAGSQDLRLWRLQELSADHFVWTQKGIHGQDDGVWVRLHNHTWIDDEYNITDPWTGLFAGVGQANMALRDFAEIDYEGIGITEAEMNTFKAELRAMRAWFYLNLFDLYRYIPLFTDEHAIDELLPQVEPKVMFEFIEKELKEVTPMLPAGRVVGHISQGAAMGFLARLYLNAEVYIKEDRYEDCKTVSEDIIAGKYGSYSINKNDYRDPFRSGINGFRSEELLMEYPHLRNTRNFDCFWSDFMHYSARDIFGVSSGGNNGVHLQPSREHESTIFTMSDDGSSWNYVPGNIYNHSSGLGNPFEKYPDADKRKQPYRLKSGGADYEGFFLQGLQDKFSLATGEYVPGEWVTGTEEYGDRPLVFIDAVARYTERNAGAAGNWGQGSMVQTGEENSGIRFNKFAFVSEYSAQWHNQSYPEIRLAEIYYNLAEIHFRRGELDRAAYYIDEVKQRNYDASVWSQYQYTGNTTKLTEAEFLDELGREFLGERRRRTDLVRFGKFGESWWNKEKDTNDRTIYPIPRTILNSNKLLEQKVPGFNN